MVGNLSLVSIGPGFLDLVTPAAEAAVKAADVVVAYDLYLTWIKPWLDGKTILTFPLTEEKGRARAAMEQASAGKNVVLISSGDIGVYGMASLVFEDIPEDAKFSVNVVPGVTAANACASLLGAPLAHDYVTLSLSDLLCPWEWIEQRARHAAEADLCMALYNVRSRKRQDGIYKILEIVSRYKGPDTVCGVVRNAYRPEQTVRVRTLAELKEEKFDMLTSIIIGNKFTRRKNQWMYTPRGYNRWQVQDGVDSLPKRAVWVFTGTSDGNELARVIADHGWAVVISTATEHGAGLAERTCPGAKVIWGHIGAEKRRGMLRDAQPVAIVDATHPYAAGMSWQLMNIAEDESLPYLRFERASGNTTSVPTYRGLPDALSAAAAIGSRIFLACGSNMLCTVPDARLPGEAELFVRVTPDTESIQKAIKVGISPANIIAMQGPFSKELNVAMWKDLQIDVVISKESGAAGGYEAKVAAARELSIPLLVLSRPGMSYPVQSATFEGILALLEETFRHQEAVLA